MKRLHLRPILFSAGMIACAALTATANADAYKLTDLGTFIPFDINTFGQMAGNTQTGSGANIQFAAAFWTPSSANGAAGSLTPLNARHLGEINDYGQVVGVTEQGVAILWTPSAPHGTTGTTTELGSGVSTSRNVSCLTSNGQVAFSTLDVSTLTYTTHLWTPSIPNGTTGWSTTIGDFFAESMNDYGQICGWTYGPGYNAMLWTPTVANGSNGILNPLGNLGAAFSFTEARDINSSGQVAGVSYGFGVVANAITWSPSTPNAITGAMSSLAPTSTRDTMANGIDDNGNAVGTLNASDGYHAVLFKGGQVVDLNSYFPSTSTFRLAQALDRNEKGQIIGLMAVGTEAHGFLLTPKTVQEQIVDVRQLVADLVTIGALLPANGQSLYSKLDAAKAKIAIGNKAGAISDLKSFISQVTTFVKTGRLTAAQGQTLISAANALIAQLSV